MRALYGSKVWAGPLLYLITLLGTLLLANESARPWAVLLPLPPTVPPPALFPGNNGEVMTRRGKHLFYTYVLTPAQAKAAQK